MLEYFKSHNPGAEPLQEGSNEAEWIVDLTTHADRDDMCAPTSDSDPIPYPCRPPSPHSRCITKYTRFGPCEPDLGQPHGR